MLWLVAAGAFDLLDGRIARAGKGPTAFGALLDSSLDRYGDAAFLGGTAAYFLREGEPGFVYWSLSALVGSFAVSYVRARSEGLSQSCRVGFWERGERLTLLGIGLFASNLKLSVVCLGIFTHVTVLDRLFFARAAFQNREQKKNAAQGFFERIVFHREGRNGPVYWGKAAFFGLAVLLWRI